MLITGDHYVVPFFISFHDIYDHILAVENVTSTIYQHVNHIVYENVWADMVYNHALAIRKKFHALHYEMQDFLVSIVGSNVTHDKHARKPRGAMNFIGSVANTLFGTATQAQVDFIHKKISVLESLTEDERQKLNVHSRVLNITLADLTQVHVAITQLQRASTLTEKMLNTMVTDIRKNGDAMMILEQLLHVHLALSTIADEHLKLRIGLQTMMETMLSPNIVTNDLLLALLKEIASKTTGLLFPPSPEFLGIHRDIIRVFRVQNDVNNKVTAARGLNFYLFFPLRSNPADTFDVFGMSPLPYPIPNSTYFMLHQPSTKYLMISESRTLYFLQNTLETCRKHDNLLICPPLGPVYTTNMESCESAVFLNSQSASSLCHKFLIKDFLPIFIKGTQDWTYAISSPLDITLKCLNKSHSNQRYTINGTGKMQIGPGCSVHSQTFILPKYSNTIQQETLQITPYPFALPLTPWEHQFIINSTNITFPGRTSLKPIPLHEYIDRLQPLMHPLPTATVRLAEWQRILLHIGGFLLLGGLLAGGWLLRSRLTERQKYGPTPSSEVEVETEAVVLDDPAIQPEAVPSQRPACPHQRGAQGRALAGGSML